MSVLRDGVVNIGSYLQELQNCFTNFQYIVNIKKGD